MSVVNEISESLQKGRAKNVKALVSQALDEGIDPKVILNDGLLAGMMIIGTKFRNNEVFVPEVLVAARAMNMGLSVLEPKLIEVGNEPVGKAVVGTVKGDLHDIGKNLVAMMVEGNGYEVIDLGVDVKAEVFADTLEKHPEAFVCMSALLTTTMTNMEKINRLIKERHPETKTFIGGAPVTADFARQIGVDYYTDGPQELVEILNRLSA